jgi:hypothetical protein
VGKKKVRVALWGRQNRSIMVDADATEGATLGKNVYDTDGNLVTLESITNTTIIQDPRQVFPTLWSLILNIPQLILDLAGLSGPGYIYHNGSTVFTHEWPLHDVRVEVNESLVIPADKQYLIWQSIEIEGSLAVEPGGLLVVLGEGLPDPTDPDFTYVGGNLTQVDYDGGEQKILSYNVGGDLERVDFIQDGTTLRKDLVYSGGDLDYIDEYYV